MCGWEARGGMGGKGCQVSTPIAAGTEKVTALTHLRVPIPAVPMPCDVTFCNARRAEGRKYTPDCPPHAIGSPAAARPEMRAGRSVCTDAAKGFPCFGIVRHFPIPFYRVRYFEKAAMMTKKGKAEDNVTASPYARWVMHDW